jgi:hypothetical protein
MAVQMVARLVEKTVGLMAGCLVASKAGQWVGKMVD